MASELDLHPAEERRDIAELSIAAAAGLALALVVLYIFAMPIAGNLAAKHDFISYWATGQQLVHRADPYDMYAMMRIENGAGLGVNGVLIMLNPPWALPLAYPLGFLGLRLAAILWTLLLLACLLVSVHMLRQLHGSPPNRIHWLGFAFTPAIVCLMMGQTALFALLGLVLFLRYHRTRPFAAGAALWLCALKPHLFLPFAAALFAWIVVSRCYKLLAGAGAALALTTAAAFLIAPRAWPDYIRMMRSPVFDIEFIPCLADAMRHWLAPHAAWLQYLPAVLSCLWALVYFWRRRNGWNWLTGSSPLMLVSLLVAPYCWFYDQGLAIPALFDGAYAARQRSMLTVLALAILLMDAEICAVKVVSPLWLWTAPAWLVWYLFARTSSHQAQAIAVSA